MTTLRTIAVAPRKPAPRKPPLDARYTAAVIPTGILAVLAQIADEEHVPVDPWLAGQGITRAQIDAYRGKYRCNADSVAQGNCLNTPRFKLGTAQNRTDLRIGWSSREVPWSVAVFANNLFDNRYVTGISNISSTTLGTPFASISAPRLWGVEAAVHF